MSGVRIVVIFGLVFGCSTSEPKAGDKCEASKPHATCESKNTALYCVDGKLTAFECEGPFGCYTKNNYIECDLRGNDEGDACWGDGAQCTENRKSMISCVDGKVEIASCTGPKRCQKKGKGLVCDQSIAVAGDSCEGDTAACTADGQTYLGCRQGRLVPVSACRGPKGCKLGETVTCDDSRAQVGDLCSTEDRSVCSVDNTTVLSCRGGKMAIYHVCRGTQPCAAKNGDVVCDYGLAEPGDPCNGEVSACSLDRKSLLSCKDGRYAKERACSQCVTNDNDRIECK